MRLEGRVAIVTGAGGGIGREHALALAREGAKVVVNDIGLRSGAAAEEVVREITETGGEAVVDSNSATWDGAEAIVTTALENFGRVDVLVNNASTNAIDDLWRLSEREWDLTVDVNLKGYFAMIRAVAPDMCRRGSGAIVNTSSGSGLGHPSHVAYAAAKEGVIGLTRTVAKELGRFGVRCNAIRPSAAGASTRDYFEQIGPWEDVIALTMGPVPGERSRSRTDPAAIPPSKVSPFVVWLCTDAASEVNGRTFHVVGDTVSRLSEPVPERSAVRDGGWDLDSLDRSAPRTVTDGLRNPYTLSDHPELGRFPD